MGISTSTALCPVSGHRAKVLRQADALTRPSLVDNLLYDKYPKYSGLDKETKTLIHQEVLKAVEKSANRYSVSPRQLGFAGIKEIAKHALPVGFGIGACGYTAYMVNEPLFNKPILQSVLEGNLGQKALGVAVALVLASAGYRLVKDVFHSGAMHAPLAREIHEAAVYSIEAHTPRGPGYDVFTLVS